MLWNTSRALLLVASLTLPACGGGAPATTTTTGAATAVDGAADEPADDPAAPGGGGDDGHLCRRSIDKPAQVFERIEAVRALSEEERAQECGFTLVERLAEWRVAPIDLLAPIVERAAADEAALVAWVKARCRTSPAAAANVVAMDVVRGWKIGEDPSVVTARADHWRRALAGDLPDEVSAVLDGAGEIAPLLERVTEIHRLRCLLEINPLGFAVECVPIHPSGRPIVLSWRAATRDGLLESLELSSCKSRSCKKLAKTAVKLMDEHRAVVEQVEQLGVDVYREQIKLWLLLPPSKSISA